MKVPSIDEARKIVTDADLGVGCVVDQKELMLARFVFENAPPQRWPDVYVSDLQKIIDAAADGKSALDMNVAVVDEESLSMKLDAILSDVKSIDGSVRKLMESFLTMYMSVLCFTVFACICFGILLIKLN